MPAANRSRLLDTFFRIQAEADSLEYRLWLEIPRQPSFRRDHFTRSYGISSVWLGNESYDNVRDRKRKYDPPYHSLHCGGDGGKLTPRLAGCTEDHWMATPCVLRPLPTRLLARVVRRRYSLPPLTRGTCLALLDHLVVVKQDPRHLLRRGEIKRERRMVDITAADFPHRLAKDLMMASL